VENKFFGIIIILIGFLFLVFIIGLINPKITLSWHKNPTRLKVFIYCFSLLIILVSYLFLIIDNLVKDHPYDYLSSEHRTITDTVKIYNNGPTKISEGSINSNYGFRFIPIREEFPYKKKLLSYISGPVDFEEHENRMFHPTSSYTFDFQQIDKNVLRYFGDSLTDIFHTSSFSTDSIYDCEGNKFTSINMYDFNNQAIISPSNIDSYKKLEEGEYIIYFSFKRILRTFYNYDEECINFWYSVEPYLLNIHECYE